jgi:co-chaperonin GroES (HSP10)
MVTERSNRGRAKMRVLGKRVAILVEAGPEVTKGGIHMPENAVRRADGGTVVFVGEEVGQRVKAGERVLVNPYAGTEVTWQGNLYRIMAEGDVLAVIE